MSTLDREPRRITNVGGPIYERRVNPGINTPTPERVDGPSRMSAKIPRGQDMTGMPKRMSVKR